MVRTCAVASTAWGMLSLVACAPLASAVGSSLSSVVRRIVNGQEADVGSYEYTVAIIVPCDQAAVDDDLCATIGDPIVACTGAMISDTVVLTAAHCINVYGLSSYTVAIGRHDLSVPVSEDGECAYTANIVDAILHPSFDFNDVFSPDIAVLRVDTASKCDLSLTLDSNTAEGGSKIKDIADPPSLSTVRATGWGTLYDRSVEPRTSADGYVTTGILPSTMQTQTMNLRLPSVCTIKGGDYDESRHVCIKKLVDLEYSGPCQGDSGGPIVADDNVIVGVVAFGYKCYGNDPSVSSRVSYFEEWIKTNMENLKSAGVLDACASFPMIASAASVMTILLTI